MTLAMKPSLRRLLDLPLTVTFYAAMMLAGGLVMTIAANLYFKGAFWLLNIPVNRALHLSMAEAVVLFGLTGIGLGFALYFAEPSLRILTGGDYIGEDNDAKSLQDH